MITDMRITPYSLNGLRQAALFIATHLFSTCPYIPLLFCLSPYWEHLGNLSCTSCIDFTLAFLRAHFSQGEKRIDISIIHHRLRCIGIYQEGRIFIHGSVGESADAEQARLSSFPPLPNTARKRERVGRLQDAKKRNLCFSFLFLCFSPFLTITKQDQTVGGHHWSLNSCIHVVGPF